MTTPRFIPTLLRRREHWDYTSGNMDYYAFHLDHKADDADDGWYVWKYTWTDSKKTDAQGPVIGTWTGRAGLDW